MRFDTYVHSYAIIESVTPGSICTILMFIKALCMPSVHDLDLCWCTQSDKGHLYLCMCVCSIAIPTKIRTCM